MCVPQGAMAAATRHFQLLFRLPHPETPLDNSTSYVLSTNLPVARAGHLCTDQVWRPVVLVVVFPSYFVRPLSIAPHCLVVMCCIVFGGCM